MRLAPALMELQRLLDPQGTAEHTVHLSFLLSLLVISFGFSFSFCLLPEESQLSVFKFGEVLREVIRN